MTSRISLLQCFLTLHLVQDLSWALTRVNITGHSFKQTSLYLCTFGHESVAAIYVNETSLYCNAPGHSTSVVTMSISDRGVYSDKLKYTYKDTAVASTVHSSTSTLVYTPLTAIKTVSRTVVSIYGNDLIYLTTLENETISRISTYTCHFGAQRVTASPVVSGDSSSSSEDIVSTTEMSCRVPAVGMIANLTLKVTDDGNDDKELWNSAFYFVEHLTLLDLRYLSPAQPHILLLQVDYLPAYTYHVYTSQWTCLIDNSYSAPAVVVYELPEHTFSSLSGPWFACSIGRIPNDDSSIIRITDGSVMSDGRLIDSSTEIGSDSELVSALHLFGNRNYDDDDDDDDDNEISGSNLPGGVATCNYLLHPHLYTVEQLLTMQSLCSGPSNYSMVVIEEMNKKVTGIFETAFTNSSVEPTRTLDTLSSSTTHSSNDYSKKTAREDIYDNLNTLRKQYSVATLTASLPYDHTNCEISTDSGGHTVPCFTSASSIHGLMDDDGSTYMDTHNTSAGNIYGGRNIINTNAEKEWTNASHWAGNAFYQEKTRSLNMQGVKQRGGPRYLVIDTITPTVLENPWNTSAVVLSGRTFTNTTVCVFNGVSDPAATLVINARLIECRVPSQGIIGDIGVAVTVIDKTNNLTSANSIILSYRIDQQTIASLPSLSEEETWYDSDADPEADKSATPSSLHSASAGTAICLSANGCDARFNISMPSTLQSYYKALSMDLQERHFNTHKECNEMELKYNAFRILNSASASSLLSTLNLTHNDGTVRNLCSGSM